MTKAQYSAIIDNIVSSVGNDYQLRLNLSDGSYVQGKTELLGTTSTIIVTLNNQLRTYIDLDKVVSIDVG